MSYGSSEMILELEHGFRFVVNYSWDYQAEEGSTYAPSEHYIPEYSFISIDSIFQIDDHDEPTGHPLSLNEGIDLEEIKHLCKEDIEYS